MIDNRQSKSRQSPGYANGQAGKQSATTPTSYMISYITNTRSPSGCNYLVYSYLRISSSARATAQPFSFALINIPCMLCGKVMTATQAVYTEPGWYLCRNVFIWCAQSRQNISAQVQSRLHCCWKSVMVVLPNNAWAYTIRINSRGYKKRVPIYHLGIRTHREIHTYFTYFFSSTWSRRITVSA